MYLTEFQLFVMIKVIIFLRSTKNAKRMHDMKKIVYPG